MEKAIGEIFTSGHFGKVKTVELEGCTSCVYYGGPENCTQVKYGEDPGPCGLSRSDRKSVQFVSVGHPFFDSDSERRHEEENVLKTRPIGDIFTSSLFGTVEVVHQSGCEGCVIRKAGEGCQKHKDTKTFGLCGSDRSDGKSVQFRRSERMSFEVGDEVEIVNLFRSPTKTGNLLSGVIGHKGVITRVSQSAGMDWVDLSPSCIGMSWPFHNLRLIRKKEEIVSKKVPTAPTTSRELLETALELKPVISIMIDVPKI